MVMSASNSPKPSRIRSFSMMKAGVALLACFSLINLQAIASEKANSYKVTYDGGSIPEVKTGSELKLYLSGDSVRFVNGKKDLMTIPATTITEISYGQDVHRRVGTAVAV